jgi:hypothetical protein
MLKIHGHLCGNTESNAGTREQEIDLIGPRAADPDACRMYSAGCIKCHIAGTSDRRAERERRPWRYGPGRCEPASVRAMVPAPACAGRDRMALRVNGRTKCDILFQSPWRRFCSAAGPWPRRPTTRALRESTECFEQVFPRVGPRFVRAAIMRGAARFDAGA